MRACDFLAEDYSVLLEYDRSKTAQAYGPKLLAVAAKDRWLTGQIIYPDDAPNFRSLAEKNPEKLVDFILQYIERGDPTPHKEYAQSIAKIYSNGLSKMEDVVSTLADYLTKFDKLKRRKKIQPPRNDFNRYRQLEDFYDVIDEYPDEEVDAPKEAKKNATELYRDDKLIVLVPNDVEAACYYGQGTRWCTAGKNNNMYDHYTTGDRPLYIIIPRQPAYKNEKYQFHFETKQFMNEQDRPIGADGMSKLVARFPMLPKILQKPAEKFGIEPLISDEYKEIVRSSTPEVIKEVEAQVEKYKQRIVQFGFKSVKQYGIELPDDDYEAIMQSTSEYIDAVMKNLTPVYKELLTKPGKESQETEVEKVIATSRELTAIAERSPARKLVLQSIASSGHKLSPTAAQHITDIFLREPTIRFLMKQIPNFYRARLQEQGHAL